jgi:hypothetical protein
VQRKCEACSQNDAASVGPASFGFDFSKIAIQAPQRTGTLQPKLTMGPPGDHAEQQADRVAEMVMRMPGLLPPVTEPFLSPFPNVVQRMFAQRAKAEATLRRQFEPATMAAPPIPPIVHRVLGSPGQPLDPAARDFLEPRFGQDFSHVRVHADEPAAASARAVGALAYTVGRDIVLGAGQYRPHSAEGRKLLAHELTHVVQQAATSAPNLQRQRADVEGEAPSVADRVTAALGKPDPVAGVGDYVEAFRLLAGLSFGGLLVTLDELDRRSQLDVLKASVGVATEARDRIEAATLVVLYRNHGSLSETDQSRAGALIGGLDEAMQAAVRRFVGAHGFAVLRGESAESQNNFVVHAGDDDFIISFELWPGTSADSGKVAVMVSPVNISGAYSAQTRYWDYRGMPTEDDQHAVSMGSWSVPAVPFRQTVELPRRAGFNPALLAETAEKAAHVWTFDWNGDGKPDFGLRIEFSKTRIFRQYALTTSDNRRAANLDFHFVQPDAWKAGYQGNIAPPVRKDDLDFWKAMTEAAIYAIPVVGEVVLLAQAVTGRNLFGEKISTTERVIDGILALLPVAGGLVAKAFAKEGAALAGIAANIGKTENELVALLRSVDKEGAAAKDLARWRATLEAGGKLTADEDVQLVRIIQQIDIDARGFLAAAQSPKLMPWRPNSGGIRTLEEAVDIARSVGIEIPDDIKFAVAKGPWPKGRFAEYLQLGGRNQDPSRVIFWEDFYNVLEEIPVRLNPEILASDEAIVAVIGHEMYELNGLRRLFDEAGGQMRAGRLSNLVREGIHGNLHDQAWDVADELVAKLRAKTAPTGAPKERP